MRYWTNKCMIPFWLLAIFFGLLGVVNALQHPEQPTLFHVVFVTWLVLLSLLGAIILPIIWKRGNRQIDEYRKEFEEEGKQRKEAKKREAEKMEVKKTSP